MSFRLTALIYSSMRCGVPAALALRCKGQNGHDGSTIRMVPVGCLYGGFELATTRHPGPRHLN